jgi:outer membrane protein TolC
VQHKWTGLAAASVLALSGALATAQAAPAATRERAPSALPSPLSAQAFTKAVLRENASLAAMRQAVAAAAARIKAAGALDDPMLSVSVAPRSFGSTMGAGGTIEVSQPLPWWGTLDARTAVARA